MQKSTASYMPTVNNQNLKFEGSKAIFNGILYSVKYLDINTTTEQVQDLSVQNKTLIKKSK